MVVRQPSLWVVPPHTCSRRRRTHPWTLDEQTRQRGRRGVANARRALEHLDLDDDNRESPSGRLVHPGVGGIGEPRQDESQPHDPEPDDEEQARPPQRVDFP